jgi:hypothetical protein
MAKYRSPRTRRLFSSIAKGWEMKEFEVVTLKAELDGLKAELDRASRTRKRKAIPNPNKRFMDIEAVLASGEAPEAVPAELEEVVLVANPQEVSGRLVDDRIIT